MASSSTEHPVQASGKMLKNTSEKSIVANIEENTGEEKNEQNIVKGNTVKEKTFEGKNTEEKVIEENTSEEKNEQNTIKGNTVEEKTVEGENTNDTSAAPTESLSTRPVTPTKALSTRASAIPTKADTSSFVYTTLLPNPHTSARLQKLRDLANQTTEASSATYTTVLPNPYTLATNQKLNGPPTKTTKKAESKE